MEKTRCGWSGADPIYIKYHDEEWGDPVFDDAKLFEFLLLETFQAGLSWLMILKKRENFAKAFDNFNYEKVARYDDERIADLMSDTGIVRNGAKIKAAVTNARAFMEVQKEFGSFSNYIWGFVDHKPIVNTMQSHKDAPATTPLSDEISADLKKRGFKFVGSTVVYAHMQATGMVDDHVDDCWKKTKS
ncbi:MAG: DNA-3-methyladenine glycosylase I [Flavobacterium sp.]|uniref:DNA-3-methyladenine glycosylase I n=1 Tax=Flavobacterium sp. TaxID=239 RepID=UPI001219B874|nr:DNA-3-methyladenine glycosylase I [Flavobacterium sp.]RZJ66528.1 MAG: DNA-3-methyladenine glycosylase I [Flavobacterium sp.]